MRVLQAIGLLFMVGCTSIPKPMQPNALPIDITRIARSCTGLDGAMNVRLYEKQRFIATSDVDWVSDEAGWRLQAIDPVGRTLLDATYDKAASKLGHAGPLSSRVPHVTIEGGYLHIDGHYTALRASELPCFWAGYFPQRETNNISGLQRFENGYSWESISEERTVKTTLEYFGKDRASFQLCSDVRWERLFGLIRRNIVICTNKTNRLSGKINILDDYRVEWTSIDD